MNRISTFRALCTALACTAILTSCRRPAAESAESLQETPSFEEVLKDGKKREAAFALMNPQVPANLSDAELEAIVNGYVNSQNQSPDYWKVMELWKTSRDRLTPLFIKVVLNPGSEGRPTSLTKDILHETPLKRALSYLPQGEHPELVSRLLALSSSSDPFVRRDVATHLAAYGSDDVTAATVALIAEPDSSEASSAMRGASIALEKGRATPGFRAALYEPVAAIVRKGMRMGNTEGDLLLALDSGRARPFLLEQVSKNTLPAYHALGTLSRAGIPVDAATLLAILEANRQADSNQRWRGSFYGSALISLARQKHPEAKIEIDRLLALEPAKGGQDPEFFKDQQEAASRALLAWEGFKFPDLWDRYEKFGRDGITEVERDLLSFAPGEIANGGFSQYFFNIDYDPREDVAAMKRLGAPKHAAILEWSFQAFGWGGPHRNQEKRMAQLENMSEKNSEILAACDEAWFSSTENLDVLENLYALKHRAELEKLPAGKVKR